MGTFRSLVILAAGAALGGAALIAYRISQETGKPLQEAFSDVPAEAQRLYSEIRFKAAEAMDRGKDMYFEKQDEMGDQMQENA
jgi:hypothetical protein